MAYYKKTSSDWKRYSFNSHIRLKKEEQNVQVYNYIAKFDSNIKISDNIQKYDNNLTSDEYIYKLANKTLTYFLD